MWPCIIGPYVPLHSTKEREIPVRNWEHSPTDWTKPNQRPIKSSRKPPREITAHGRQDPKRNPLRNRRCLVIRRRDPGNAWEDSLGCRPCLLGPYAPLRFRRSESGVTLGTCLPWALPSADLRLHLKSACDSLGLHDKQKTQLNSNFG